MKINVSHVAKLANLTLSAAEEKKFEEQLSDILSYIEKLNEVDTKNVEPTSQVTGLENVTREDIVKDCELAQEEALSNSKSTQNGLFKVKAILDSK
ncbi:MAG: Asp-tRNA(Asn)/Glu-tRNA(Gln) amidotransferase subunit GatC [Candidatus Levybacteria bacterium]|nr:Asp-tRNA(Asn)/Glu-tRNA(Gln) amidotransferase subunit GatC [Candidatus Levybacteria bacterium]